MNREGNNSGLVVAFLSGALVGAAAALLLAPKSGKETRKILADYGVGLKDKLPEELRKKADATIEHGRHLIDRGQEMVKRGHDIVTEGREYIDEKKRILSAAIEAGRAAMEHEKEALAASHEQEKS
ncbi:MAG: YtxH domain-containing protein [Desulfobulbaceae bacterium]|nr:YtxH domain-containing protein [Desulfobulbaceae bacterium]